MSSIPAEAPEPADVLTDILTVAESTDGTLARVADTLDRMADTLDRLAATLDRMAGEPR